MAANMVAVATEPVTRTAYRTASVIVMTALFVAAITFLAAISAPMVKAPKKMEPINAATNVPTVAVVVVPANDIVITVAIKVADMTATMAAPLAFLEI